MEPVTPRDPCELCRDLDNDRFVGTFGTLAIRNVAELEGSAERGCPGCSAVVKVLHFHVAANETQPFIPREVQLIVNGHLQLRVFAEGDFARRSRPIPMNVEILSFFSK